MAQLVSVILIRWIVIYPVDSAIQHLNNQGQKSVPEMRCSCVIEGLDHSNLEDW